jgi:hypothetical protein
MSEREVSGWWALVFVSLLAVVVILAAYGASVGGR